jgi:ubiquinone/menaquinone biosynthesis C-methylase UbiE
MSHEDISQDRRFIFEEQEVMASDFDVSGRILDLGGGGEGTIGRLKAGQVIAIDPSRRELEDAAPGPLKVVMDARDLQFLDNTFSAATSFFALMYITASDHTKVFDEVFRVLTDGAPFFIWDVAIPSRAGREQEFAVLPLVVRLPMEDVSTEYGLLWPETDRNLDRYRRLAGSSVFEVVTAENAGQVLKLHLRKSHADD